MVVTGATAGVGRATARSFAGKGARIGLIARGREGLDATVRDVRNLGGQALAVQADVADAEQVEAAAATVEETLGPIDIWVNNAMTSVFSEFKDVQPDEYRRVTDVVYHGQVYGAMAALKRMRPRNRGTIVFVGSALAYRGIPLQSAYCGAKHAVQGLFESLRAELLHAGSSVRVTMVQLPALNTPQFGWVRSRLPKKAQPVPPIYQPEIAADAIVWASHHNCREIYVGFPSAKAIVGNKIAPNLADHYLARNAYKSQMRDEPEDPDRPDNLFTPVEGDFGAHGDFDARARTGSGELWIAKHKRHLFAAAAVVAGIAVAALPGSKD